MFAAETQKYGSRCITDEIQHIPKLFGLKTLLMGKVFVKTFWERQPEKSLVSGAYSDSESEDILF
jgi:hypothetical protein